MVTEIIILNPLNEIFCDIIVFIAMDQKILLNENKDDNNPNNIPKDLLGKTTANIKFAFNYKDLPKSKNQIKPTRIKDIANETYLKCTNDYAQKLKVDSDSFPVDKVMELFWNPQNINFLNENSVFINDIDFTQNFSGLIDKEEVIEYLINNQNFRMQGSDDSATHTVLDNDYKISRNCLTFKNHTNNGDIRFKFYNKFIQSLESPSVRDLVGRHIGDYISNPNNNLKSAISGAKETGLLRLEITFYRHTTNKLLSKDFILKYMKYLTE